MKITFTAEKQREILSLLDIKKNESSMYETIMFKAVDDYIENTMKKQGVGIVLQAVGYAYFNDVIDFTFKGSKKKMEQENYAFVGAKGSDVYFYGFLSKEDLFEKANSEKRGIYNVNVSDLKEITLL